MCATNELSVHGKNLIGRRFVLGNYISVSYIYLRYETVKSLPQPSKRTYTCTNTCSMTTPGVSYYVTREKTIKRTLTAGPDEGDNDSHLKIVKVNIRPDIYGAFQSGSVAGPFISRDMSYNLCWILFSIPSGRLYSFIAVIYA